MQEVILDIISNVLLLFLLILLKTVWNRVSPWLQDAIIRNIVADGIRYAQKVYGHLGGTGRYEKAFEAISLRLEKWHIYVSPEELKILIESILKDLQGKFGDKWYELPAR